MIHNLFFAHSGEAVVYGENLSSHCPCPCLLTNELQYPMNPNNGGKLFTYSSKKLIVLVLVSDLYMDLYMLLPASILLQ